MEINQNAPMVAQHTVTIEAPPAVVWALLTDIDGWPRWQSAISRAQLQGPLAIGTQFNWTSGGTAIVSTIRILELGQRFGWTGTALGTTTEHIWTLQAAGTGTLVTTTESMSGWLIRLVKPFMPGFLTDALQVWLAALKQAAETQPSK